jgi:hypothetical protein
VLILVICSALAFRYARSLAIGGNLLTSSLIISNYSTSPGAAPSANAIWDSLSYPSGKVHFDVWVRGKKGTINYYFWANCPNYNSSTVYNVASLGAVCGGSNNYTYSASGWASMYMNHNFDYNYTSAGQFKPVILVERGGVFIHKGMDIALKPKIDLFVEYSSSSSYTSIQKEADGDYSPTVQMVNTIAYGQYARLKWDVRGVPAGNTCTASSSAGAPVWTGSKALSGVADLGQMTGGSFVYRLTCSYASTTNYDEITLNIPPYVELTGSIPSFTAVTATNSQTVNINSVANPAPLNAGVTLSGYTKGADRCTITSSPTGYVPSPTSYTTTVTSTRIGVFSNKISTGINAQQALPWLALEQFPVSLDQVLPPLGSLLRQETVPSKETMIFKP